MQLSEDRDNPKFLRDALFSFLVNVAYLNLRINKSEKNYCMLVHTSGKKLDHVEDYEQINKIFNVLKDENHQRFGAYIQAIWNIAKEHYPGLEDTLTKYVRLNVGKNNIVVMNSDTDKTAGEYKTATF